MKKHPDIHVSVRHLRMLFGDDLWKFISQVKHDYEISYPFEWSECICRFTLHAR